MTADQILALTRNREPDFVQIVRVLRGEVPERPTLFEFFLNGPLYELLAGEPRPQPESESIGRQPRAASASATRADKERLTFLSDLGRWYGLAQRNAGYDFVNIGPGDLFPEMRFRATAHESQASHSLNEGAVIADREDMDRFPWPEPPADAMDRVEAASERIPTGMKLMLWSPNGVLENLVDLLGYDQLCFALADDRDFVRAMSDRIGSTLLSLYRAVAAHPMVGALIANDDWGFKTQTMISPDDLREFVFPWYEQICSVAREHNKPILLHSCGQLENVMDDVIDGMGFNGKHSWEDVIFPVEQAYDRWGDRVAILGGIDVDFLCTARQEEIAARCRSMVERVSVRGAYALGSGNSIPEYIPMESYFTMIGQSLE